MSGPPNFTIVTLGVEDLDRSSGFCRALGWEQRGDRPRRSPGFEPRDAGSGRSGRRTSPRCRAGTRPAIAAGATLAKAGTRADRGGYSGYFADPDGDLWKAAVAPGFPVGPNGTIDITD